MYALIHKGSVIRVLNSVEEAEKKRGVLDSIVPIGKDCLFSLRSGNSFLGRLIKDDDFEGLGTFIVLSNDYRSYPLSEVDFWQPIGEWLSF